MNTPLDVSQAKGPERMTRGLTQSGGSTIGGLETQMEQSSSFPGPFLPLLSSFTSSFLCSIPHLQSSFPFPLLSSPPKCHSLHFVLCLPSLPLPSLPFPTSQYQSHDLFSFTTPSQPWWNETMKQNQSLLLSGCQASHRPNRLGREIAVLAAHTEGS